MTSRLYTKLESLIVAIYSFLQYRVWWAVFTRRHIWSYKRCLERMNDLNVAMQH